MGRVSKQSVSTITVVPKGVFCHTMHMMRAVYHHLQDLRHTVRGFWSLTEGEQQLVTAYAMTCAFGAGLGLMTVTHMSHGSILEGGLTLYHRWIVLCGALGCGLALKLAGDRMGQSGPNGFARGMLGVVWVSVVGAVIAGTLALPFYGTMFGPFTLAIMLVSSPMLALMWFANLLASHLLIRNWRTEQDRLFARLA